MKLKLIHKGLILVSVPLIFGLIFTGTLWVYVKQAETEARLANRSKSLVAEATTLSKLLTDAGMALVAWRYTRSSMFVKKYDEAHPQIDAILKHLETLTDPGTIQRTHAENLKKSTERILKLTDSWRHPQESASAFLSDTHAFKEDLQRTYDGFMVDFKALTDVEEAAQIKHPRSEEEARERVHQLLLAGVMLNVVLTIIMAVYFSRKISDRLSVLSSNALLLSQRKPLNRPIDGTDEVADLDKVFHDMAQALTQAEQRKRDFVSMISHDLRTPLSSLQTTLALINRGVYGQIDAKGQDRVADAEQESERLIALINELLDIDKIDAGMLDVDKREVELDAVIERAVNAVQAIAEKRKIAISFSKSGIKLGADENRLVQVLVNLLSNAIKYSPEGTPVAVSVSSAGREVELAVVDRGRGIAPGDLKKIFEPFQQLGAAEDGAPSSGLGLAITKAIVVAHGGTIGVESEPGAGSKFWVKLPVA